MPPRGKRPRRRTTSITTATGEELKQIIEENLGEVVKFYETTTDQSVTSFILDAVHILSDELKERERQKTQGDSTSSHDHSRPPEVNVPPATNRKRRREDRDHHEPVKDHSTKPHRTRRETADVEQDAVLDAVHSSRPASSSSTSSHPESNSHSPSDSDSDSDSDTEVGTGTGSARGSEPPRKIRKSVEKNRATERSAQKLPKKSRRRPVARQMSVLSIVQDSAVYDLEQNRKAFHDSLLEVEVVMKHDGKQEIGTFTPEQADSLTTYIFEEIIGEGCFDRLVAFMQSYTPAEGRDNPDAGASARLRKIAHDKTAPSHIRRFFGTFSHNQDMTPQHPVLENLRQIVHSRELFVQYSRVRQRMEEGDEETIEYLKARGMMASVGRGWSSVAIDFLAQTVGLKRHVFVNICERAKGINPFVEIFGEGILPLLPPHALSKLRKFGNQRMAPAYALLKEHVKCMQLMCDWTKENFYDPFVQGAHELKVALPYNPSMLIGTLPVAFQKSITTGTVHEVAEVQEEE